MLPAAILAGGLATRLRPLTEVTPKSLILIHGEPFIAHQLRLVRNRGVERVVLCVGFLGEKIREFVSNGEKFGLSIDYCWDGAVPQGTAGALRKASPLLGDAFFVVYGDAYLPCNYRAVEDAFFRSRKSALMTIFRNEGRWGASNVEFVNEQILAYDKLHLTPRMHHIDYGLGVFLQSALAAVPDGPCDLSTVYQGLLQRNDLASFHVSERFYEVGSFDGIESFSKLKLENYE